MRARPGLANRNERARGGGGHVCCSPIACVCPPSLCMYGPPPIASHPNRTCGRARKRKHRLGRCNCNSAARLAPPTREAVQAHAYLPTPHCDLQPSQHHTDQHQCSCAMIVHSMDIVNVHGMNAACPGPLGSGGGHWVWQVVDLARTCPSCSSPNNPTGHPPAVRAAAMAMAMAMSMGGARRCSTIPTRARPAEPRPQGSGVSARVTPR